MLLWSEPALGSITGQFPLMVRTRNNGLAVTAGACSLIPKYIFITQRNIRETHKIIEKQNETFIHKNTVFFLTLKFQLLLLYYTYYLKDT